MLYKPVASKRSLNSLVLI